jgi:serine/threonine-protein kinase
LTAVWRAHHRLLPRQAAVKFVRPSDDQRSDPAMVQDLARRFEREAKAIALLRSPHTIQLYDFGLSPEGDLFYAMELLDGYDLETLVTRFGPLPEARACRIIEQICLSLGEAHRAGLVHRDVKPGNIMLCRLGEDLDVVKVLDFGLVGTAHGAAAAPGSAHGVTGFAGTPGYIAPELIFGQAAATAASDLYGVGAVAYWLLTGTTVFPGADGNEDLVAHSMDAPQPPGTRLGRPIEPRLEALVLSCLAKRPQDRPAGAMALRERLRLLGLAQSWDDQQAQAWWDMANAAEGRQP